MQEKGWIHKINCATVCFNYGLLNKPYSLIFTLTINHDLGVRMAGFIHYNKSESNLVYTIIGITCPQLTQII